MVTAAVLAGGRGMRMGASEPKQFIELASVPIIIRSINAMLSSSMVDSCIVCTAPEYIEKTQGLIDKFIKTDKKIYVTGGGAERGETLLKILEFMKEQGILDSIIVTHDAVRPFVTRRIIEENIAAVKKYGACGTCVPSVDTVLISSDGAFIDSVPPRGGVFRAQTPQSFNAAELYRLIKATPAADFAAMTDGCSVYIYHGKRVYMVRGEEYNIKITFPEDIRRAENIAAEFFQNN